MAFKRISSISYVVDSIDDLETLPQVQMGAEAFVIEEACEFMVTSDGRWIKQSVSGEISSDLTGYATEDYVENKIAPIYSVIPNIDGLASEEYVQEQDNIIKENMAVLQADMTELATNPVLNMFAAQAPDNHQMGLYIEAKENKSLVEAMMEKGLGMYNFWIEKGAPNQPDAVTEKNSSCRGLCCVDTYRSETNWYGWIMMFDQDGDVYMQYIRNAEPKGWKQITFA